MVWNEIKLYDDWRETYKDFAMQKKNYTEGGDITHGGLGPFPGQMVPRVIKTNVGDIFTTNTLKVANTDGKTTVETISFEADDVESGKVLLTPNAQGYLDIATGDEDMVWQVVKVYTLPDNQDAVKVMRIK